MYDIACVVSCYNTKTKHLIDLYMHDMTWIAALLLITCIFFNMQDKYRATADPWLSPQPVWRGVLMCRCSSLNTTSHDLRKHIFSASLKFSVYISHACCVEITLYVKKGGWYCFSALKYASNTSLVNELIKLDLFLRRLSGFSSAKRAAK